MNRMNRPLSASKLFCNHPEIWAISNPQHASRPLGTNPLLKPQRIDFTIHEKLRLILGSWASASQLSPCTTDRVLSMRYPRTPLKQPFRSFGLPFFRICRGGLFDQPAPSAI